MLGRFEHGLGGHFRSVRGCRRTCTVIYSKLGLLFLDGPSQVLLGGSVVLADPGLR